MTWLIVKVILAEQTIKRALFQAAEVVFYGHAGSNCTNSNSILHRLSGNANFRKRLRCPSDWDNCKHRSPLSWPGLTHFLSASHRGLRSQSCRMNSMPLYTSIYMEHIVFGVVHDMRRQIIKRKEICHLHFLLPILNDFHTFYVGVYYLVSWQEVMFDLLVSVMEFDYILSE